MIHQSTPMSSVSELAQRVAALADEYERRCDAIAITYQDPDARRQATGAGRAFVRELRALLEVSA